MERSLEKIKRRKILEGTAYRNRKIEISEEKKKKKHNFT